VGWGIAKDCDWRRLVFKPGKPEILKKQELGFCLGGQNRTVSIKPGESTQVQHLDSFRRLLVHLKKFGKVKVFRLTFKKRSRKDTTSCLPDSDATAQISQQEFNQLHSIHGELNAIELSSNCVEFRGLWLGQVRQSKLIFIVQSEPLRNWS